MNKTELIAAVAAKTDCTKVATAEAINATVEVIMDTLMAGEKVALTGFGVFAPKTRAARTGRNPQTGETIEIPEHVAYTFKAGKGLKA